MMAELALEVHDLAVQAGLVHAVNGVSFSVPVGNTFGLVGESGAGKSMTARAVLGLLPEQAKVTSGSVKVNGEDLLRMPEAERRRRRGAAIALVLQNPLRSLNPTIRIGPQIVETILAHERVSRAAAGARALELLDLVQIPEARARFHDYPHQLSGGMRQRVVIAIALACAPGVLIADEPTTALDVTTQSQILELLRSLQERLGMAIVLITHDMRVAAEFTHRMAVMYAGRIVEEGLTSELIARPRMPYTRALLDAIPSLESQPHELLPAIGGRLPDLRQLPQGCAFGPRCTLAQERCATEAPALQAEPSGHRFACWYPVRAEVGAKTGPAGFSQPAGAEQSQAALLDLRSVSMEFPSGSGFGARRRAVQAVSDVSLSLRRGESFGLLGGTGSGKSTLLRCIVQFPPPTAGQVLFRGKNLTALSGRALLEARRGIQMVFQDPYSSIDSRWSVGQVVAEPLVVRDQGSSRTRRERVAELLDIVGLDPHLYMNRTPRQLSGGQCQRVAIARALALSPELLLCDEPVSALDVSIQAQILNLFEDLRRKLNLTYLFVSHDLSVIRHVSDRAAVMFLGKLVEIGLAESIYRQPAHPYTAALLSALPGSEHQQRAQLRLKGEQPSPMDPPSGCRFRTRCPLAQQRCAEQPPPFRSVGGSGSEHQVACHFPLAA